MRVKSVEHHAIGYLLLQSRTGAGEVLVPVAKQVLQQVQLWFLVGRVVDFWYELHCALLFFSQLTDKIASAQWPPFATTRAASLRSDVSDRKSTRLNSSHLGIS